MPRLTRSTDVDVAEDETAVMMNPQLLEQIGQHFNALAENPSTTNAIASTNGDPLNAELNGLKAAFRSAIGVTKKGKKSKAKRKPNTEEVAFAEGQFSTVEPQEDLNLFEKHIVDKAPEVVRDEQGPELMIRVDEHLTLTPPQAGQTTRQPSIKKTSGQFEPPISSSSESCVSTVSWLPRNGLDLLTAWDGFYIDHTARNELVEWSIDKEKMPGHEHAVLPLTKGYSISLGFRSRLAELGIDKKNITDERATAVSDCRTLRKSSARGKKIEVECVGLNAQTAEDHVAPVKNRGPSSSQVKYQQRNAPKPPQYSEMEQQSSKPHNQSIICATPTTRTLDDVENACALEHISNSDHGSEDSFVDKIISRLPAKRVSRIEDSLEALDQLEDALEAVDTATLTNEIPPTGSIITGVKKTRPTAKKVKVANGGLMKPVASQPKLKPSATLRIKSAPKKAATLPRSQSACVKGAKVRKGLEVTNSVDEPNIVLVKPPASLHPPKPPAKSCKPATRPTFELPGEAIAKKLKEQRQARLAQRSSTEDSYCTAPLISAPLIKSTKAPTKPSFELPGEALSLRKLKDFEARVKAQEEEDRKKREFKATPIRNNVPRTLPRETVASRARQSKIGIAGIGSPKNGMTDSKRASNICAPRPSILQSTLANSSAPRTPGPNPALSRKSSDNSSAPSTGARTVSNKEVHNQHQRARVIYCRDAKLAEDHECKRKEREAAAKRSREEAAERGRQASREWAERQKAKKVLRGPTRHPGFDI